MVRHQESLIFATGSLEVDGSQVMQLPPREYIGRKNNLKARRGHDCREHEQKGRNYS